MTQQIFRRADIAGAAEIPTLVGNGGGGGIQNMESILRQFEGIEKTLARFMELFERFGNQALKMRGFEAGSAGLRPVDAEGADPEPMRTSEPLITHSPVPPVPPKIDVPDLAQKVYSLALGAMAQLPQDMNIAEALMMAREKKNILLPVIEGELKKLLE